MCVFFFISSFAAAIFLNHIHVSRVGDDRPFLVLAALLLFPILFRSAQLVLNLRQRLIFRLRHQEVDEQRAEHAVAGEYPERDAEIEPILQIVEALDDDELEQRGQNADDAQRDAFRLRREQLAHHDTGYGAEAQREHADVDGQAGQRHPRHVRHVVALLLGVKEGSQRQQADSHYAVADQQQHSAASAVHQQTGQVRHDHLQRADDDGRMVGIDGRPALLEDLFGVKYHNVDARKRQEAEQTHDGDRRPDHGSTSEQHLERLLTLPLLVQLRLDIIQLAVDVVFLTTQQQQRTFGFLPAIKIRKKLH